MTVKVALLVFVVQGQLVETLVCELARDIVLIEALNNVIQLHDTLFSVGQELFLFDKVLVSLFHIRIHNHLNKSVLMHSRKGNDLSQIM